MKAPVLLRWCCLVCLASTGANAAPQLAGAPQHVVTPHQVTIWWNTVGPTTTEVHYGPAMVPNGGNYPFSSTNPKVTGPDHSRTLSFLAPGVWYYRVRARDGQGASVESPEATFTIRPPDQNTTLTRNAFNGPVKALARVGTALLVGGRFTNVATVRGSGLFTDPITGSVTDGTPLVAGTVRCSVPDGAGGVFIGGEFEAVGGLPRRHVAHLLADQGVDPNWSADVNGPVYAMATGSGRLYVGGSFSSVNGSARRNAAALSTTTGSTDPVWSPNPNGTVLAIASGSFVYLGGTFTQVGPAASPAPRNHVAAVDGTTGLVSATFDPDVNGSVNALAVDNSATSLVFLGGSFSTVRGGTRNNLAAVDGTTGVNKWSSIGANNTVYAVSYESGTLYVGGAFTSLSGTPRSYVGAVDAITGQALTWAPTTSEQVFAVSPSANEVYVGGSFRSAGASVKRMGAALFANNGTSLVGWDPDLNGGAVYTISRLGDGTTFLGGSFTASGGTPRSNVAAIDLATDTLLPWDPNANSWVNVILPTSKGVFLGGNFTEVGNTAIDHLALVTSSGAPVSGPPSVTGGAVTAMSLVGNTMYLAGGFGAVGGQPRERAGAFDVNSNQPLGWSPVLNADAVSLTADATGVVIGGDFTAVNSGVPRNYVAAFDPATAAATSFDPSPDAPVWALSRSGPRIFLGGAFAQVRNGPHARLSDVDAINGVPSAVNHGFNAEVFALASSGKAMAVGGKFTQAGLASRRGAAVIDPFSGAVTSFSPEILGEVQAVLPICPEGVLVVGGDLGAAGLDPAGAFAAFRPDTLCPPSPDGGTDGGVAGDGGTSSDGGVAPRIVTTPSRAAVCMVPYVYAEGEVGPRALPAPVVWSIVDAPAGLTLDAASGALEWTPARAQTGPQSIVVQASSGGGSEVQRWEVTVTCEPPSLQPGGCGCSSGGGALVGAALLGLIRRRRTRSARAF